MDGLFTRTNELLNPMPGLGGLVHRGPSRLFARRLGRRHTALGAVPAPRPTSARLFFAVLPDAETAARIAERTARWRADHGLRGRPLRPEHFHVKLCQVADAAGASRPEQVEELVGSLAERVATLSMPAFRVAFDRVMSFANGAFVLAGDESEIGLEVLQQRLSDALDPSPRPARRFAPHMALLHDSRQVAEQPVERIAWTARDVVLVQRLQGQATHREVARVALLQA